MITLNIQVTGDRKVVSQLKKLRVELEDWQTEMKQIGKYLMNYYSNDVFISEGAALGSPWRPLSPQYEFQKRKMYPGAPILQRTGNLRRGFTMNSNKSSVTVRNKVPYASFHLFGTRKMVAREFMGYTHKVGEGISDIFIDGVKKKIRKAI